MLTAVWDVLLFLLGIAEYTLFPKLSRGKKLEKNYYDRMVLATVLGEIPQKEKALKELFHTLNPGGILPITEVIFDCHFQRKSKLRNLAKLVRFEESKCVGNHFACILHLQKPLDILP